MLFCCPAVASSDGFVFESFFNVLSLCVLQLVILLLTGRTMTAVLVFGYFLMSVCEFV